MRPWDQETSDGGWRGRGIVVLWFGAIVRTGRSWVQFLGLHLLPVLLQSLDVQVGQLVTLNLLNGCLSVHVCQLGWAPSDQAQDEHFQKTDGCVEVASNLLRDTPAVFDFTHKHQKHSSTDVNVYIFQENKSGSWKQSHKFQFSVITKTSEETEEMCNVFFSEVTR